MNVIKSSESFYQNNINKLIFDLPVFCIKLIEDKIKRYIGFTPITYNKLKTAVDFWCDKEEEGLKKYGHISNWNVQNITDMSYMFSNYVLQLFHVVILSSLAGQSWGLMSAGSTDQC